MGPITAGMISIKTTCTSHEELNYLAYIKTKITATNGTSLMFDTRAKSLYKKYTTNNNSELIKMSN